MKTLSNINVILRDKVIDILTITNNMVSSRQSSIFRADDDYNIFFFVKDLVSLGDDSLMMNFIKYIKETEVSYCNKRLINLINMNIEGSSNI